MKLTKRLNAAQHYEYQLALRTPAGTLTTMFSMSRKDSTNRTLVAVRLRAARYDLAMKARRLAWQRNTWRMGCPCRMLTTKLCGTSAHPCRCPCHQVTL